MEIILKAVSKKIGYTQVLDNINCLFLIRKLDMNFDYLFRSSYMPV